MHSPTVLYLGTPEDTTALAATLGHATVLGATDATTAERHLEAVEVDLVAVDPDVIGRETVAEIARRATEPPVVAPADTGSDVEKAADKTVPEAEWPDKVSAKLATSGQGGWERAFTRSVFSDLPDIFYAFDGDGQFL
jgi:3D (Asp-Asp-Asp) domain-containing protein